VRQRVLAFVPASSGLDHIDSIAFKGVLRTAHPCCIACKGSSALPGGIRATGGPDLQGLLITKGVSRVGKSSKTRARYANAVRRQQKGLASFAC